MVGAILEKAAEAGQALASFFLPQRSKEPGYDPREVTRELGYIRATLVIFAGVVVIAGLTMAGIGVESPVVSGLWALVAAMLLGNLIAVRQTGRFFTVTTISNWAGLLIMGPLMYHTGGVQSPYAPLFLVAITITGNFGGLLSILTQLTGYMVIVACVYVVQPEQVTLPGSPATYLAFLLTSGALALVGNMSAQVTRTRTRHQLRRAVEAADLRRREAENARTAAETAHREAEEALERLRDAQEQMVLQEKMASLGGLVAGVAHEVNTPVGLAVTGASQLTVETRRIREAVAEGRLRKSEFEEYVGIVDELARLIEHNAGRAATLIQSFKEVAVDQSSGERRLFELDRYVGEVLASLSPQLRKGPHTLVVDIPGGIVIDGYPGSFAQVLTNLVMNTIMHGFAPGTPGRITIAARKVADGRVELTYCDNGRGIPRELWSRIFEPFFTTKRGSGGSGLGLHLLWNIVTGPMGGRVEVGDAPGGGARFTLVFPEQAPIRGAASP